MHQLIQNCSDPTKIKLLKQFRNKAKTDIRKEIRKQNEDKLLQQIEVIEKSKNDSRRMFNAIKVLNSKPNSVSVKNKEGNIVNSRHQQIEIITDYFSSVFHPENTPDFPDLQPKKLDKPFSVEEISCAIKSLKNNKSAGIDKLKSEHLKFAPVEIHQYIADILNDACEHGQYPKEISQGLLTPLQKPGKPKGPPENLRPVILLSVLRKILAICVIRRISDRLFRNIIPPSQAAYRAGRSTTELVFAFRLLIEKAITSEQYELHLLLLDMSKAFDRIQRKWLIEDLQTVLNDDELHLVGLLLKNVQIAVKLNKDIGNFFNSTIGSPQGDSASAIFFITYLARSKRVQPNLQFDYLNRIVFLLEQQYSDDCSFACTNKQLLEDIKHETINSFQKRNLAVNPSKAEEYSITSNGNEDWKNCKLVGSFLDTRTDISKRKQAANSAYCKLKPILTSRRTSLGVKIRVFRALIESIFLYNSEIWTLTKGLECEIDVFQRKLLRYLLGIRWSANNWISNTELYRITKLRPWSCVIRHRRLSFFGHVCRLGNNTPARIALAEALRPVKRPKGRAKTTYLSMISKDLSQLGLTVGGAITLSLKREEWNRTIGNLNALGMVESL